MKGEYGLAERKNGRQSLKEYNDELVEKSKISADAKSSLTELRSLPFVCISNAQVKAEYEQQGYTGLKVNRYNINGRISEMYFIQIIDEDILQNIHK